MMLGEHVWGYPVYDTLVLLSALVGALVVVFSGRRLGLSAWRLATLEISLAAAALAGAKLYGLVEEQAFDRFSWETMFGGFRYPGALVGLLVATPILARWLFPRVSVAALADVIAPSIGFAEVVGRMGCFLSGCCFGTVSSLPWAVTFPEMSVAYRYHVIWQLLPGGAERSLPVHPLQLYFALLGLGLGFFLLWFQRRKEYDGQVILLFVALHEWGKFFLEFLRAPIAPMATPYLQGASFLLATGATVFLVLRRVSARSRIAPVSGAVG